MARCAVSDDDINEVINFKLDALRDDFRAGFAAANISLTQHNIIIIQIFSQDLHKALRSFPPGSSGGPDGLTPQHIHDLLTGATDNNLQQALVDWVNLMLAGSFDKEVNEVIYGGRLIALQKKDEGIRPITVCWLHTVAVSSQVCQQLRD